MSFLDLKKREDRVMVFFLVLAIVLLSISHGISYGWWAFVTVPLFVALCVSISVGLTLLMRRARRRDMEDRLAELEGRPVERRESAWSRLWSPKRGR